MWTPRMVDDGAEGVVAPWLGVVGAAASYAAGEVSCAGAGVGASIASNCACVTISTDTGRGGGTTSCRSGDKNSSSTMSDPCSSTDATVPAARRRSTRSGAGPTADRAKSLISRTLCCPSRQRRGPMLAAEPRLELVRNNHADAVRERLHGAKVLAEGAVIGDAVPLALRPERAVADRDVGARGVDHRLGEGVGDHRVGVEATAGIAELAHRLDVAALRQPLFRRQLIDRLAGLHHRRRIEDGVEKVR